VYERHQLRIQDIYQASFEEAITSLDLVDNQYVHSWLFRSKSHEYTCIGKPHQTFPNQSFPQIIDINSSRAQKQKWETLQKKNLMPTAPSVPRQSPIQVLTRLNVAQLQ
jgi:hypothetical protein